MSAAGKVAAGRGLLAVVARRATTAAQVRPRLPSRFEANVGAGLSELHVQAPEAAAPAPSGTTAGATMPVAAAWLDAATRREPGATSAPGMPPPAELRAGLPVADAEPPSGRPEVLSVATSAPASARSPLPASLLSSPAADAAEPPATSPDPVPARPTAAAAAVPEVPPLIVLGEQIRMLADANPPSTASAAMAGADVPASRPVAERSLLGLPREPTSPATPAAAPAPPIEISIGRIEVALVEETPRPARAAPAQAPRAPQLPLSDYLQRRDRGQG